MIVPTAIEGMVCFMVVMLVVEIVRRYVGLAIWRRSGSRKMSEPAVVSMAVGNGQAYFEIENNGSFIALLRLDGRNIRYIHTGT